MYTVHVLNQSYFSQREAGLVHSTCISLQHCTRKPSTALLLTTSSLLYHWVRAPSSDGWGNSVPLRYALWCFCSDDFLELESSIQELKVRYPSNFPVEYYHPFDFLSTLLLSISLKRRHSHHDLRNVFSWFQATGFWSHRTFSRKCEVGRMVRSFGNAALGPRLERYDCLTRVSWTSASRRPRSHRWCNNTPMNASCDTGKCGWTTLLVHPSRIWSSNSVNDRSLSRPTFLTIIC